MRVFFRYIFVCVGCNIGSHNSFSLSGTKLSTSFTLSSNSELPAHLSRLGSPLLCSSDLIDSCSSQLLSISRHADGLVNGFVRIHNLLPHTIHLLDIGREFSHLAVGAGR